MKNRLKKIAKYVLAGGLALFVKKLWDPILDPFVAPVTRILANRATRAALRFGFAA